MTLAEEYQELMGEAADTADGAEQGSDQSYEDLTGQPEETEESGEEASEDTANTEEEGSDPAENEAERPTQSREKLSPEVEAEVQRRVDRAFAGRRDGLYRQYNREHEGEFRLAKRVRSLYSGLSDDEIMAKLDEGEADELSRKTGWDKSESLKRVQARREYEAQQEPRVEPEPKEPEQTTDPYLETLMQQREHILKRSGVDVAKFLKDDPYLAEQVNKKKMDLHDVYAYVLENRDAARPAKAPPVSTRRTAAANIGGGMSDAEFEKAEEMLRKGIHVRI